MAECVYDDDIVIRSILPRCCTLSSKYQYEQLPNGTINILATAFFDINNTPSVTNERILFNIGGTIEDAKLNKNDGLAKLSVVEIKKQTDDLKNYQFNVIWRLDGLCQNKKRGYTHCCIESNPSINSNHFRKMRYFLASITTFCLYPIKFKFNKDACRKCDFYTKILLLLLLIFKLLFGTIFLNYFLQK